MTRKLSNHYVITVLVGDRVGILRDITSAVTDMGGNIDGISQTVVSGYFTVILTATFKKNVSSDDVRAGMRASFSSEEADIIVRPYESESARRVPVKGSRYAITATGHDRIGVLKKFTSFLAGKNINIEDWAVEFDGSNVTHIGVVSVPRILDVKQTQEELRQLLAPLGFEGNIQHENIFRVTNEIGAIKSFLR